MPNPLGNISISAPGFFGKNTQDSPLDMDTRFAALANNAVIDQKGRLAARKGYAEVAGNNAAIFSTAGVDFIQEFEAEDGTKTVFTAGNDVICTGTSTLTDVTPGATTVTASDWQGATLSNKFYLFQSGHEPLVFTAGGSLGRVEDEGGYVGTVPQGNCVAAAFGRLFVGGVAGDMSTVYWSDLLDGLDWGSGSSGSIDLTKFWPGGYDEVQALHVHNNFLIIFGRYNTLIYQGAGSPSTMVLIDTIANIGCVARDSVQSTGKDVLFLSHSGVRALGRTIQEKSLPIALPSKNVEDEVEDIIETETAKINAVYNPEEKFYLLSFPGSSIAYCFDIRRPLEDGSFRATTWTGLVPTAQWRADDDTYYLGTSAGLCNYTGYQDDGSSYDFNWLLHPQSFGDPARLKFIKHIHMTWEGGYGYSPLVKWSYDYGNVFKTGLLTIAGASLGEYGIAEYNIGEYSGSTVVGEDHLNATGSGRLVTAGVTITIDGQAFSLQEFNVQATIGRMI
jgi:hypothetical protein